MHKRRKVTHKKKRYGKKRRGTGMILDNHPPSVRGFGDYYVTGHKYDRRGRRKPKTVSKQKLYRKVAQNHQITKKRAKDEVSTWDTVRDVLWEGVKILGPVAISAAAAAAGLPDLSGILGAGAAWVTNNLMGTSLEPAWNAVSNIINNPTLIGLIPESVMNYVKQFASKVSDSLFGMDVEKNEKPGIFDLAGQLLSSNSDSGIRATTSSWPGIMSGSLTTGSSSSSSSGTNPYNTILRGAQEYMNLGEKFIPESLTLTNRKRKGSFGEQIAKRFRTIR